jgi:hypothetical protein
MSCSSTFTLATGERVGRWRGRTTTSGDDHADHDAGQLRTAISQHEPIPRSVLFRQSSNSRSGSLLTILP